MKGPSLYEVIKEPTGEEEEYPKLSGEKLDRICDLDIGDFEIESVLAVFKNDIRLFHEILLALRDRNLVQELPVGERTFLYQRNLAECQRLKRSVFQLLDAKEVDLRDMSDPTTQKLIYDAVRLLILERRKAAWLESAYYPALYRRALGAARGEVNQFSIEEQNTRGLEKFRNADGASISLKDELNYLLEGHNPLSVGVARGGDLTLRIPEYFSDKDEWDVYLIALHELVHYISRRDCVTTGIGVEVAEGEEEYREVNEATTQMIACLIAFKHITKRKTKLKLERPLPPEQAPYGEYILVLRGVFDRIPFSYFVDALLNEKGFARLRKKFAEVFDFPGAFEEYSKKLYGLFLPRREKDKK